jgi:hypothetical protein
MKLIVTRAIEIIMTRPKITKRAIEIMKRSGKKMMSTM